jgi:hypothetical protein
VGPAASTPTASAHCTAIATAGYAIDDIRAWGCWTSDAVLTYFRGGAQERWYPAPGSRPDMNDIVASVVALRGRDVCPGWGVHDDILACHY